MTKRTWIIGAALVLALAGIAVASRTIWSPQGAVAQSQRPAQRAVSVEVAIAEKRKVPVRTDALGSVTPIASVAIKSRIETEIVGVHFADGALVKKGDLLFSLDSRSIEAQIREIEAIILSARAQLEQNQRDLERYTGLVAKNAITQVQVNNTRTQVNVWTATVNSNAAKLENLRVMLSYCEIRAPITGRISQANVKVGNFVRPADVLPLATIIQTAPVYVTFGVPQRTLADLREALNAESATVEAIVPGTTRHATGQVTMIENTVDPATGMVTIRATMPNADELLWPGTLVTAQLTLRVEEAVVIPTPAVQVSQQGTFVFVVKDGVATVQPVKVARVVERDSVIASGLEGGETVVTDGQLLLTNGARVTARERKVGS